MDLQLDGKQLLAVLTKHKVVTPIGPSGWKDAGNALLAKKELAAAVQCYSKGIEEGPKGELLCLLLSNRAQAYLGLHEAVMALVDAEAALAGDAKHPKSHFRRGRALYELERYAEAKAAFALAGEGQDKHIASCEERDREKQSGAYNWTALLQETIKNSEKEQEVADYRHPAVTVLEVLGKGRGCLLSQALPKGTLVVAEKAVAVSFPSQCFVKRKAPGE
jgi:tetratricopeptide (TPR) repeat protein